MKEKQKKRKENKTQKRKSKEKIKGGKRRMNKERKHSQLKSKTLITVFFSPSISDKSQLSSHNYKISGLQHRSYFIAGQIIFSFLNSVNIFYPFVSV
jgi:hypothetical protein